MPAVVASPAHADDSTEQGVLLPQLVRDRPSAGIVAASSSLFLMQGGMDYDENAPDPTYRVVRRSDGQVLRTFQAAQMDSSEDFQLIGSKLVRLHRTDFAHGQVEVTDAITGTAVHTIDITGYRLVHADSDWALVTKYTGPSTGHNGLFVARPDGTFTQIPENFDDEPQWVGGDADTAYVGGNYTGTFAIDISTGTRTQVTMPDNTQLFAVTSDALIGSIIGYPDGKQSTLFRAVSRTTLQPTWSVDVPTDYRARGIVTYGDGLAQLYQPDDAPAPAYEHLQLRPVDLSTGDLAGPVASDIFTVAQLPDQQVALSFADTPGGRVAVADGTSVTPFGDLPDVHSQALDVGLSGSLVAASWQDRDGVQTTPRDGSGTWTNTYPNPGFDDGDREVSFAGDVVMTNSSYTVEGQTAYRLQWPGGSRDFKADSAFLGHGGRYAERFLFAGPSRTEIVDVKTGTVARTYPGSVRRLITGTRIWEPKAVGTALTSTDLVTGNSTSATLPAFCANGELNEVRGRWAEVACSTGAVAVNLDDPTQHAPMTYGHSYLGNGFAVQVKSDTSGGPMYATVTDLITGATHKYGPVRGQSYPPGIGLAVNDDDTTGLVYIDSKYQVRRVDLSWVTQSTPPSTDAVTPHEITSVASPTITATPRVGVTVKATPGTWTPAGTYAYQWLANGAAISGATGATYTPDAAALGKALTVRVTASATGYRSASASSAPTRAVVAGKLANTKRPAITGAAKIRRKLTAVPGTWTPGHLTFAYQWLRDGKVIKAARSRTYTVPRSAKGHRFSVRVTAKRAGYNTLTKVSKQTAKIT